MQNRSLLLPENSASSWWIDVFFIIILLGCVYFIFLGSRPLFVPDEGRYAEIAREMAASGNYLTPFLNGIKYFEKPVLFYWLELASIKLNGLNLWSLRSINALLGIGGAVLTYWTARTFYGRLSGLLSAFILASTFLYFTMAHMVNLDLTVSVFLSGSLYAFILGYDQPNTRGYRYFLTAATCSACAVLTKGLIGIVFPCLIIGLWMALCGRLRHLLRLPLFSCMVVFLVIAAPWHVLMVKQHPEFFYFYFFKQHFLRYATKDIGHYQPIWYFIPVLILGFFPWIGFLPQALAQLVKEIKQNYAARHREMFFLLWALFIFIFFSFSKSKLIPYILPTFPPLAILLGRYLGQVLENNKDYSALRLGSTLLLLLAYMSASAITLFDFETSSPPRYLYLAAGILVCGSSMGCFYAYRIKPYHALMTTLATSYLFLVISLAAIPSIDTRTILPLTQTLSLILKSEDDVITFNQYYQDLPFYLRRTVSVLNWRNELSYGMRHQKAHDWLIDDDTFWQRFHSQQRVFVILSNEEYENLYSRHPNEAFYVLDKTTKNTLMSNQKPEIPLDMLTH